MLNLKQYNKYLELIQSKFNKKETFVLVIVQSDDLLYISELPYLKYIHNPC